MIIKLNENQEMFNKIRKFNLMPSEYTIPNGALSQRVKICKDDFILNDIEIKIETSIHNELIKYKPDYLNAIIYVKYELNINNNISFLSSGDKDYIINIFNLSKIQADELFLQKQVVFKANILYELRKRYFDKYKCIKLYFENNNKEIIVGWIEFSNNKIRLVFSTQEYHLEPLNNKELNKILLKELNLEIDEDTVDTFLAEYIINYFVK